jgi:uncharacterized Zn finger protein
VARPEDLGQIPERAHVARLIPRGDDLLASCTCPDWDDPCKHAVAALLALAAELASRPELLVSWRCGEVEGRARTKVGSRARPDRHLRLVQPSPPTSLFDTQEWHEFAGDNMTIPRCEVTMEPLSLPAMNLDRTDVAEVIRSAWQALSRFRPEHESSG